MLREPSSERLGVTERAGDEASRGMMMIQSNKKTISGCLKCGRSCVIDSARRGANYSFGNNTASITWITPFEVRMSALTTFAPLTFTQPSTAMATF